MKLDKIEDRLEKILDRLDSMDTALKMIESELNPNLGYRIKDTINNIDKRIERLEKTYAISNSAK